MTILAYRLLFCMTLIFFTLIKKLMGNNDGNEEPSNSKVQRIINELGGQLLNYLPKINWQFESVISKQCEPILPRRLHLMLDKRYFPTPEVGTIRELQLYWSLVAIHTAAYVYKTVGAGYSEAMKVWLANAAYATIAFSLIGEIPRSENKITVNPDTVESISVPDSISIDEADGNWFYGQWTNENLASEVDMQDVIRPEMIDACLKVMLAAVVNFYHENRFTPSQTSIDNDNSSYAVQIIKGDLMDQYGIVDQSDKIMVMKITGQWISRIRVFNVITCLQTLKHPLRDIRTIGPGKLPLTREVRDEVNSLPSGWQKTQIAEKIAIKLVNCKVLRLFPNIEQLNNLKSRLNEIIQDPFYYHTDASYLTATSSKPNITDDANNLLGQLITFLKYSEPNSELFTSSYLKVDGRTREQEYDDYDENWEMILKRVYACDVSIQSKVINSELEKLILTQNNFTYQEGLLRKCLKLYNVKVDL